MRQCFTFTYSIRLEIRGPYVGYSRDPRRQLSEHKEGASRATSYRGP